MSQFPPNPYNNRPAGSNPYIQGPGGVQGPAGFPPQGSPYASPGAHQFGPPPQSTGSTILWILFGLGSVTLLCCCGCGGIMTAGLSAMGQERSELVRRSIEASPEASAEIGTPVTVSMNFGESLTAGDGDDIFDITGPKGKGKAKARITEDTMHSGRLDVNGKNFSLGPQSKLPFGQ